MENPEKGTRTPWGARRLTLGYPPVIGPPYPSGPIIIYPQCGQVAKTQSPNWLHLIKFPSQKKSETVFGEKASPCRPVNRTAADVNCQATTLSFVFKSFEQQLPGAPPSRFVPHDF